MAPALTVQTGPHRPLPRAKTNVAFVANSRDTVDALYRAALDAGGHDDDCDAIVDEADAEVPSYWLAFTNASVSSAPPR